MHWVHGCRIWLVLALALTPSYIYGQFPAEPIDFYENEQALSWEARLERHAQAAAPRGPAESMPSIPADFSGWWESEVLLPYQEAAMTQSVDLHSLLVEALQFSPQVRALRETAFIRSTALIEADAEFDVNAFMESKFIRLSDPVGDDLTTGGPPRFRDSNWHYIAGTRKRIPTGANFEFSQRVGYRDNNSLFLNPTQQGNARLSLSFTQPLLSGAGRTYNESRLVLAQLDTRAAEDEMAGGLQEHLVQVTRAYWDLYLRRAIFRQKQRHVERARIIQRRLEDRRHVDVLQSQLLTARAAVAVRSTDLNRAAMSIRNAESRIRTLVAAPELYGPGALEFVPATTPARDFLEVPLRDALATALYNRPDVDQALQQIRMAGVRLDMSTNQMLPVLNVVLETYVAGLEGQSRVGRAWLDQFSVGEPGYTAGLVFEIPLGNRAARARHERRQAEFRQALSEFETIMDAAMLEVEIAVREVQTSYRDITANHRSMVATGAEVDYLNDRWTSLPGDDRSASFLLEDLLKAQDRLAESEFAFSQSQVVYTMAHVKLKRSMGVLMAFEDPSLGLPMPLPALNEPPNQYELPPPAMLETADRRSSRIRRLPPVR